jgi:hypothetical protein
VSSTIKREIALVLAALGIPALIGGSFLTIFRTPRLSQADGTAAFAYLAKVNLDRISASESLSLSLPIPDTPQWVRIRQRWGVPDFLISAKSQAKTLYCLSKLPVTFAVMSGREQIATEPSGAPYGYSSDCPLSSRKFHAAAGTKLTIRVARNGSEPLPAGELIIAGNWSNSKDKLAGITIDEDFGKISTVAIAGGLVLISLAAWLSRRRPV